MDPKTFLYAITEKRTTQGLRPVAVRLDGLDDDGGSPRWFPALTTGELWNGFSTSLFERHVADQIVQAFADRTKRNEGSGTRARYDEGRDAYVFEDDDLEDGPEVFGAVTIESHKLYPIGSHFWAWTSND